MEEITLKLVTWTDEDYFIRHKIIQDKTVLWQSADLSECPEDATLSRDMTNGYEIQSLLERFSGKKVTFLPTLECSSEEEWEKA